MRTRRSWKNQNKLWRDLGGKQEKPEPKLNTAEEIEKMWWLSKTSKNKLLRERTKK